MKRGEMERLAQKDLAYHAEKLAAGRKLMEAAEYGDSNYARGQFQMNYHGGAVDALESLIAAAEGK